MVGTLLLGQKSSIWDISFKMYEVSAKSQNFVNISGVQKSAWAKFLEFDFFHQKIQGYIDITKTKLSFWSHHLHT